MALLAPENHMTYLDEFAGIQNELSEYKAHYDKYCEIKSGLSELIKNEREKAQKLEFLRYQINEIEALKLKPDEEKKLLARRKKLQNAERYCSFPREYTDLSTEMRRVHRLPIRLKRHRGHLSRSLP